MQTSLKNQRDEYFGDSDILMVDHALAMRLEQTEAIANARFVEARQQSSPASNACWISVGGTHAMFDGPDSPCTQTFGLGVLGEPTESDFSALEDFFTSRGAATHHEVAPFISPEVLALLNGRGYRPIEFTNVMCRRIGPATKIPKSTNASLSVRAASPNEADMWAQVSATGWSESPEFQQLIIDLARNYAVTEGCRAMFAFASDMPIATGVLTIVDRVALLAGASTIPQARKQGAQSALLETRLQLAIECGCDVAMMCALPGSPSQRNAQRNGFQIAYTRTKWKRDLP